MRGGARERVGMGKDFEEKLMKKVGMEIRKELKEEIEELRKEIGAVKEEINEMKREEIRAISREINEMKREIEGMKKQERAEKQKSHPTKPPSLEDMRKEWATLVGTVDKMSANELVKARNRIQFLGKKLDSALGENYLLITQKTIEKIDRRLKS